MDTFSFGLIIKLCVFRLRKIGAQIQIEQPSVLQAVRVTEKYYKSTGSEPTSCALT